MDLYREELKVWKECSQSRESKESTNDDGVAVVETQVGDRTRKVPGAFEW